MSAITIEAKKRSSGKRATKDVRQAGMIPGVFYAKGKEPIAVATTHKQLRSAVYTSDTHIINLRVEGGETLDCILRDVSFDPVTDAITHFDLQGIIEGQTIHLEVPIILTGNAKGVTIGGGLMEHLAHKLHIQCLPHALPEHIEVDVTSLEVGKSIHASDIHVPGAKILTAPETVIVIVHARRTQADASAAEAKS